MFPLLLAAAIAAAPPQLAPIPIAKAVARGANGALLLEGREVRVVGVATTASTAYYHDVEKVFVQDGEAGISLFKRTAPVVVAEGDRIDAVGTVTSYNGEPELQVGTMRVLGHGKPPQPIEILPEELRSRRYEGRLVQTEAPVDATVELPRGMNIVLRGVPDIAVHVAADQLGSFPKDLRPGTIVRVTGVASEYTREGRTMWEILPRASKDVVLVERGPRISAEAAWTIAIGTLALSALVFAWIVSLRRKVQHALAEYRELDERYRFLFEDNPMPMWVCDANSKRILTINRAAIAKYGFTAEEFRAMSFTDLGDAENRRVAQHRTKNGRTVFVEVLSAPIVYAGRNALIFLAVDVTEWAAVDAQTRGAV